MNHTTLLRPLRSPLVQFAMALMIVASSPRAFAAEGAIARQLVAIEAEERISQYRTATVELLALRRELTLLNHGEGERQPERRELTRRIEGLERWKEQYSASCSSFLNDCSNRQA